MIICIDDDPQLLKATARLLARETGEDIKAFNIASTQAVEALRSQPALVITDNDMTGLSGTDVALLCEQYNVPCIIYSGNERLAPVVNGAIVVQKKDGDSALVSAVKELLG